ncbi:hypothetical protein CLOM_g2875 [Closterium sp. NIES-68]|nr:hypothetical protein CLOM_g2875 [Closterium sp. NIES-68]GJP75757.1 hypothetical protein CLOP_g6161 [Closterium sp. NIES-67]
MRPLFQSPSSLPRQHRRTPFASGRPFRTSRATRFNAFFFLLVLSLGGSLLLLWRLQLLQRPLTEDGKRLTLSEKVTETNGNAGKADQGTDKRFTSGSSNTGTGSISNSGGNNKAPSLLDADNEDDYDDADFLLDGSTDATSAGTREEGKGAGKADAIGGENKEPSADVARKHEICKRMIKSPPLVCAHGGDASYAPPNTLAALERAVAVGADAVEVDASLTADGHLVALHDRELQSLLNDPSARVSSLVFSRIRQLDLSSLWPATSRRDDLSAATERVPVMTLQQALQALIDRVKHITVDVKIATSAIAENRHMAQRLVSVFEKVGGCSECLVWSKEDQFIRHLSRIQPSIKADWVHSLQELQDWGG